MEKGKRRAQSIDCENRNAMRDGRTVSHYASVSYAPPGESEAIGTVAVEMSHRPILDIGVGGGRTTPMLRKISDDYVAIDYTPAMVEGCRSKFPGVQVIEADARALPFPDASKSLVVFSCAGLDMVGRADRLRILREVARVLEPGGAFVFSTHHRGASSPERSLRRVFVGGAVQRPSGLVARAKACVSVARWGVIRVKNHLRLRALEEEHAAYAILNSAYHDYATLMYFVTLDAQRRELADAGFLPNAIAFAEEGGEIGDSHTTTPMLNIVARRLGVTRPP